MTPWVELACTADLYNRILYHYSLTFGAGYYGAIDGRSWT